MSHRECVAFQELDHVEERPPHGVAGQCPHFVREFVQLQQFASMVGDMHEIIDRTGAMLTSAFLRAAIAAGRWLYTTVV